MRIFFCTLALIAGTCHAQTQENLDANAPTEYEWDLMQQADDYYYQEQLVLSAEDDAMYGEDGGLQYTDLDQAWCDYVQFLESIANAEELNDNTKWAELEAAYPFKEFVEYMYGEAAEDAVFELNSPAPKATA